MRRQYYIIILFTLCYLLSRSGDPGPVNGIAYTYHTADSLFNLSDPTNETDASARKGFSDIIATCNNAPSAPDSFLFNALWKKGVLEELLGNYDEAKICYLESLKIAGRKPISGDSIQFKPLLYAGGIYYRENKFDSTRILLEKAQALTEKYKMPEELERLYNILGALYFEGGNYLQSKNCFEKALQLIEKDDSNSVKKINFENNIATALNRLGQYDEALKSYQQLLRYKRYTADIMVNIGNIYIATNKYREALSYFHYSDTGNTKIEVFNYIANAHLLLKQYDSAYYYLNLFEDRIHDNPLQLNRITIGVHHIYKGDYFSAEGNPERASGEYQKAIVQLMYDYADTTAYNNPVDFSGTISSFNLFNALIKKAWCFEQLYTERKDVRQLEAAMETYLSAINLAAYLERTMDTDEARIFLKQNSNYAYNKSVDLAIKLYNLTKADSLLWKAYNIIERNKASVLVTNVKDFEIKNRMHVPDSLLQQERDLKYKIARLQIKMDQLTEDSITQELAVEKRNDELNLAVVQKRMRLYTGHNNFHEQEDFSVYESFLKNKLETNQGLLDFYISDSLLYVFAITNNSIHYHSVPASRIEWDQITTLQKGLHHIENISGPLADSVVRNLFTQLIQPVFPAIKDKKEWIILPDGAFYYFPFEVLVNPQADRMLIEDYAISYNFSTQFISDNEGFKQHRNPKLIALAPFVNKGMISYTDSIILGKLPATRQEIAGLAGTILMDTSATKNNFLHAFNHYDILHLATHAVMDARKPSQSFIAFYPDDSTRPESYKLYLNELYGMNLDSTRLMLLSACETGVGKFVEGEGVMSLSRGVLYAGCPSVVTTLWPANDQSTAYIVNHFYKYMSKGYDLTNALRLSKLDFIKEYPRQRHPSYWAHLVLVGKTEPLYTSSFSPPFVIIAVAGAVILFTILAVIWWIKKSRSKKALQVV